MTDQKWSDRQTGDLRQSDTEYFLDGESKQADNTNWSGPR